MKTIQIEIDESIIPDGFEVVGIRSPKPGEYIFLNGTVVEFMKNDMATRVVLKKKRWRAEKGDRYWAISECLTVDCLRDDESAEDDMLYEAGNYFRTKEDAERFLEAGRKALEKNNG